MKTGRNQPCPCGSGKKFKKCHGAHDAQPAQPRPRAPTQAQVQHFYEQHLAKEPRRKQQQGLGRPILSAKLNDQQVVYVGNHVFHSRTWKTFPDFLGNYFKQMLTPAWGNAEIAKPLEQRHPIMQWYDSYCRFQLQHVKTPGEITESEATGLITCYLGLAYSLYLLHHNVELQTRLLKRLKDPGQFQGAYYELIVANTLIRAGFKLTLEDETDGENKHCEFSAVSEKTGKKYWVEAKMRSVVGLLGRTEADGSSNPNPIAQLNKHLTQALKKPAADERLIFVDLNTPEDMALPKPAWCDSATRALERYEHRHPEARAYVIVTNLPFHRMLDSKVPIAAVPFGLNMKDFNRPGHYQLSIAWKNKQNHIDAFNICHSLERYVVFPSTFDGSLPSEAFERDKERPIIGETYFFEDGKGGGHMGTVNGAIVNEQDREAILSITGQDGINYFLKQPMSEAAVKDYKEHPDTYFGKIQPVSGKWETIYELFEWLMSAYEKSTRAFLLAELKKRPQPGGFDQLSDDELRALYCERMAGAIFARSEKPKPAAE